MNEDTPAPDDPVAVEWWHRCDDDGSPELDTFHGFHNATRITDGDLPAVETGELVTESGIQVTTAQHSDVSTESRYLYLTHEEALNRDLSPCSECFPAYATEMRLSKERGDGGLLTESGVEGAVFLVQIRRDMSASWNVDSVHETYTSMLYRARAIRQQVGSAADRLRLSYMPVRRCDYGSFDDAMGFEPAMDHVSELREIQPEELPAVRESVGEEVLSTPVEIDSQYTAAQKSGPSIVHRAENAPCGYERELGFDVFGEADEDLRDQLQRDAQTVSDVIERGIVVEYCPECFPELANWVAE
ncbi:hypothetical protein [Halorubrum sp. SD683]|uniref:hypothetical protein n=1 Tax=Halorubrum sp. SD683 TaxID=1855873 RepID=UPI001E33F93E|nr:hypothetical protein [Halorubrum sp. SD683]